MSVYVDIAPKRALGDRDLLAVLLHLTVVSLPNFLIDSLLMRSPKKIKENNGNQSEVKESKNVNPSFFHKKI